MKQLSSHWKDFDKTRYLRSFFLEKMSRKFKFHQNPTRITGSLHEDSLHLWQYLAKFVIEWEMFETKVVEKIRTHILCSITFFRKPHRLWDNTKYGGDWGGNKWRHNMAHTRCMLYKGCMHLRECTRLRAWVPARTQTHRLISNTDFQQQQ